jgi:protein-disulfide isomerase
VSTSSKLESITTAVIAVCAVAVTIMVAHRELTSPADPNAPQPPTEITDWKNYGTGAKRIGPVDAPVTIVEFSDFQCPFCAQLFHVLQQVRAKHPHDVSVVYRNFPLQQIHPNARPAAIAAECAAAQGAFESYHDFLFEHQDSLGKIPWATVAKRTGVADIAAFKTCLSSGATLAILRNDSLAGQALHIHGTPTVVVNEWELNEPPTTEVLEGIIAKQLEHSKQDPNASR